MSSASGSFIAVDGSSAIASPICSGHQAFLPIRQPTARPLVVNARACAALASSSHSSKRQSNSNDRCQFSNSGFKRLPEAAGPHLHRATSLPALFWSCVSICALDAFVLRLLLLVLSAIAKASPGSE